jgi:hypothetical protein
MQKALLHRYDNKADILEVEKHCCSEVYRRSRDDSFDVVIVVPTSRAGTQIAVIGDATSGQYTPPEPKPWPGRPDVYPVRVDLANIRRTTLDKVRKAVEAAGENWPGQWTVRIFAVDETLL